MKLYHKNPRQITKKQYNQLSDWLLELGDLSGIVHDLNSDEIIGGNQRSRIFDINKCQIVLTEEFDKPDSQGTVAHGYIIWTSKKYAYRQVRWTPEQCEKANIVSNKGGGDFDFDGLANNFEIDDLLDWGFSEYELEIGGFELPADELPEDPGVDVDRAEELREKWGVESGMMFALGSHRLICGDCTDVEVVDRVMDGKRAQLVVTDPPYNVSIVGGTHDPRDKKNYGKGPRIENDQMSDVEFDGFLYSVFKSMATIMDDGAVYYVCAPAGRTETQFRNALDKIFTLRECIVWVKQQSVFGRQDYHWQHESILYGWNKGKHYFCDDHTQTTVWNFDRPMRSEKEHPTQKPVSLFERMIANSSVLNGTIYDPFLGSGTTLIACERLNRKCRAVEISPGYVGVALERWHEMTDKEPELIKD